MPGVRQAGLGYCHSKQLMAEHAAEIRGAVESSLDGKDKTKAVIEEPAGLICATSPRTPKTSVLMAILKAFIYHTIEQPNFFLCTLSSRRNEDVHANCQRVSFQHLH